MKKILLLLSPALLVFGNTIAQNAIPNPGFETWINKGSYDNPSGGWGTIADISGGFVENCFKESGAANVHSGTYSVKLQTISTFQGEAPGIVVTGTINQQTFGVDGGVVFSLRPDSMVGWYKYSMVGTDTASVDVRLSYWSGTARVQVAQARFERTSSQSSYARFAKPFLYSSPNNPDTMVIVLMSSYGGATSANTNSTAYYDDLDLIYSPTGINEHNAISSAVVYPNPTASELTFSTKLEKYTVKVMDAAGKQIRKEESDASNYRMNVSELSAGIYFYELIPNDASQTQRGKFSVVK